MGAMRCLHLVKPSVIIPLMGTDLETGAPLPPVPERFWARVVAELGLTPRQRGDVVGLNGMWAAMHARCAGGAAGARGHGRPRRKGRMREAPLRQGERAAPPSPLPRRPHPPAALRRRSIMTERAALQARLAAVRDVAPSSCATLTPADKSVVQGMELSDAIAASMKKEEATRWGLACMAGGGRSCESPAAAGRTRDAAFPLAKAAAAPGSSIPAPLPPYRGLLYSCLSTC
jgi:hypothetical protein